MFAVKSNHLVLHVQCHYAVGIGLNIAQVTDMSNERRKSQVNDSDDERSTGHTHTDQHRQVQHGAS